MVREDAVLVLAAGQGTRMRSTLPKVLHPLAGKPMISRVLDSLARAGFPRPTVLVGHQSDLVRDIAGDRCDYVTQDQQLGTGHATRVGLAALPAATRRLILVHGDEPLIPDEIYLQMLAVQKETHASIVLLTTRVVDSRGFGRVVRSRDNQPIALLQESELSPDQMSLDEVNLGAYVFDVDVLRHYLPALPSHPPKGEFYLTDVIGLAASDGVRVATLTIPEGEHMMGINDLAQLEQASRMLYASTNRLLMETGVTILNSPTTFIDEDVTIEPGTVVHPFTTISGDTHIGSQCQVGPQAHIMGSRVGDRCRIKASTLEHAVVSDDVSIGPYAHLRPGARIGARVEIGSFAEIKQSTVGERSRIHHFAYLGDADIGADVNIGAGTVTCNYDGSEKHRTVIEDGAFIGSDTMLRAPVRIGSGATTGAGSVVTRDVPPGMTVAGVPAREVRTSEDESSPNASAPRLGRGT